MVVLPARHYIKERKGECFPMLQEFNLTGIRVTYRIIGLLLIFAASMVAGSVWLTAQTAEAAEATPTQTVEATPGARHCIGGFKISVGMNRGWVEARAVGSKLGGGVYRSAWRKRTCDAVNCGISFFFPKPSNDLARWHTGEVRGNSVVSKSMGCGSTRPLAG
jgi:hypothetical protein